MKSKDQQIQELQKQVKDLKRQNLKLTVENEFVKNWAPLFPKEKTKSINDDIKFINHTIMDGKNIIDN